MTDNIENNSTDEFIGYGHPPKSARWKKGETGNRFGRRKGSRNFLKVLEDILSEKLKIVKDNGEQIKISKKEVIFHQAVNKACKGDLKALALILPKIELIDIKAEERTEKIKNLGQTADGIIQEYLHRRGLKVVPETPTNETSTEVHND